MAKKQLITAPPVKQPLRVGISRQSGCTRRLSRICGARGGRIAGGESGCVMTTSRAALSSTPRCYPASPCEHHTTGRHHRHPAGWQRWRHRWRPWRSPCACPPPPPRGGRWHCVGTRRARRHRLQRCEWRQWPRCGGGDEEGVVVGKRVPNCGRTAAAEAAPSSSLPGEEFADARLARVPSESAPVETPSSWFTVGRGRVGRVVFPGELMVPQVSCCLCATRIPTNFAPQKIATRWLHQRATKPTWASRRRVWS
jgi:hypothetical protein